MRKLVAQGWLCGALLAALPDYSAAAAQEDVPAAAGADAGTESAGRVQSAIEALAQDAREYLQQHDVTLDEAMRRLRAQEESVPATDALRQVYRDRLAGVSIEHQPTYRIIVLLTGSAPVADQSVLAGGMVVPIVFRTGAAATEEQVVAAMKAQQATIRSRFGLARGMGFDPRTGELVVMVDAADLAPEAYAGMRDELVAVTGVPVRIRALGRPANFTLEGGSRVEGVDPVSGRRSVCTTGFVVTGAAGSGISTAAHCPDTLTYRGPDGRKTPLNYVGAWGARYQDVQIHVGDQPLEPLFYADAGKTVTRTVTGWRNRTSTRAGDFVCHRGERTGYSCSQVELVDYAPPRDLCAGPCEPVWVTVTGPACQAGDSGGPVFSGTLAFGILKGGSYRRDGSCSFYYYMSTDYLPAGWSLLYR